METVAVFSLGSTVLEFARFGIELLRNGAELYKSSQGALSTNQQLELATADLRALLVKLRTRPHLLTTTEDDFSRLLQLAENTAGELVERLERLKVKDTKSRKWKSVYKAIEHVWTQEEISMLTKKLAKLKQDVNTHVLHYILETLDKESLRNSSRYGSLDKRTQLIILSLVENSTDTKETNAVVQDIRDHMATLLHLVRRIDHVNTDEHCRTRRKVAKENPSDEWAETGIVNEITAKFEMLDVSDIQEIKLRRKVEEDILKTLAYPAMTDRYEDIIEAFPETFEWAFKGSTEEQLSWDNLSEWLKAGSGVYWISGKAGSGKSTLMKHIFDDVRTRQFLKLWTTGNALNNQERHEIQFCLATFFFWNTGTSEQKSQSGLLRSLLYQALSSCPELIPVVFPEIWAKRYSDLIETLLPTALDWGLTLRRLTSAFRKLTQQTAVPLKLCFLVDGLDEFYGDHEELATLFKLATKSPTIKICLSSRPWVIFEGIYGSRPSMRLQDLTYYDIKHYVISKFNNNPAFHRLQQRNPEAAVLLQSEVIEKAEGVFLWVQIVVKSLLLGIRQEDDIEMLRQRLIAMPPRVEDLYLHIISLIDPIYMTWASKTFQILRAARELCTDKSAGPIRRTRGGTQLNMLTFFFAITETFQFHINGFGETCLIEKDSSSTSGTLTQECLPVKCATIKTHLTARCAGLLEVPRFEQKGIDAPIQFFHQTAQDFIHKKDKWSQMVRYTQDTAFDPHRALLMASVLELAIRTADRSTKNEKVYSTVKTAIMYAYHLNLHQIPNPTETAVLDKLNQIMVFWSSRQNAQNSTNVHWSDHLIFDDLNFSAHTAFLRLTTLYGLANYVDEKLGKLDRKSAAKIASKLLYILLPDLPCESWRPDVRPPIERPEMISTLLHHGADPNFGRGLGSCQTTTWTNTLWHISNYASSSARCTPAFVHNMKLLLMAGADLYAKGGRGLREEDVESTVKNSIVSVARFRDEGLDLLDEIIRQKSLAATEAMDHGRDVRPRKKKRVEQEDLH